MIKMKQILLEGRPSESKAFKAIEDNLDHIAYQFAETGARYAGKGFWGRAYKTDAGRVLKITSDPNEVAIASRFKKLSARPHVSGIYDVRPIKPVRIPFGSDDRVIEVFPDEYYVIHMDAVIPLESYKGGKMAELWEEEHLHRLFFRADISDQQLRERYDHIAEHYGVFDDYVGLMSQRRKIMQDARALGLSVGEAHAGNVGFNQHGNFVIYDMQSNRYGEQPNPNNLGRPVDLTPDDTRYDWTGIMDVV
jgi:hypothetical protein